eukprot:SAG31_NODE_1219_length_9302_cov_13.527328_3_plen_169_part_00
MSTGSSSGQLTVFSDGTIHPHLRMIHTLTVVQRRTPLPKGDRTGPLPFSGSIGTCAFTGGHEKVRRRGVDVRNGPCARAHRHTHLVRVGHGPLQPRQRAAKEDWATSAAECTETRLDTPSYRSVLPGRYSFSTRTFLGLTKLLVYQADCKLKRVNKIMCSCFCHNCSM